MNVTISNGNETIIKVSGRLDVGSAGEFEKEIQPLLTGQMSNITIDCSELEYISSAGLRSLMILNKASAAKGEQIFIKSISPIVKDVFDMTGFSSLFNFIE
ncbi:MAG: STAS domain-containing protein [Ignavibacteria bacterium]|jgi:anti-anti-sigma factor|nr:STAS domain-containing protein [Ignavibacteria bacterium]